ncbi:unnamed protein product [Clavelina lepadiformis]|uniref:ATP synthase F0 subunit 8 n=1 Tax=Clavelina lepadiformis TaxID=159417 RepID=A0ABP0GT56_CLALP
MYRIPGPSVLFFAKYRYRWYFKKWNPQDGGSLPTNRSGNPYMPAIASWYNSYCQLAIAGTGILSYYFNSYKCCAEIKKAGRQT